MRNGIIFPTFIIYIYLCMIICGVSDLFLFMLIIGLNIITIYMIIDMLSKKPKRKDKFIAFRKMFALCLFLLLTPTALAEIDFDQGLTQDEEDQIDAILEPVMKIYNFIKYTATVIAVLVLVFAGVSFLTAGGEQAKKERAKNMAVGVVIGLVLIWMAPLLVEFIFT